MSEELEAKIAESRELLEEKSIIIQMRVEKIEELEGAVKSMVSRIKDLDILRITCADELEDINDATSWIEWCVNVKGIIKRLKEEE